MAREWIAEMVARLNAAKYGQTRPVIDCYATLTGKSPATLYRIAGENGWKSGRKPRRDKGSSAVTKEQISLVSSLLQTTAREVKGCIMDVETALSLAEDNGLIAPGQISVSRMQALLREHNMQAEMLEAPEPKIQMRSLHPNHVHVLDASICIQYYLRDGKGMAIMDERKFYKNKPENFTKIKNKLIRYVLTDHFSHTIFVKYYYVAGENQKTVYDFLLSAWGGGKHEQLPFRGVCRYLLMDAGAANIAKAIVNLLGQLDVKFPEAMPHNPSRQGSAEVAQNIVETKFESRLRIRPATTIEELNDWAIDWAAWFNATKRHSRHGLSRTACWLRITAEQLRELPSLELMHDLYAEPEVERTVDGSYCISFRSQTYLVKHVAGVVPRKSKVRVILRPFVWPQIGVAFGDAEYLVEPVGTVEGGFRADAAIIGEEFKALPESPVQKVRKVNENLAFGEERAKGATPFAGTMNKVFGHHAEKVGNLAPMPKRGTPIEVGREAGQQQISITELLKRLRAEAGPIGRDLNQALKAEFGESIEIHRADEVVAAIAGGEDWRAAETHRQAL